MNRLNTLFESKKDNLLSIYFTAGYPELNTTVAIAEALEKAGVDFLEIGFPYSDPVADGPTIQHSSQKALENGMNLNQLFEELKVLEYDGAARSHGQRILVVSHGPSGRRG